MKLDNLIQRKTYNITEAAKVLGVSKPKMYQLCHIEGFPALRLGARIVIPIDRLDAWLNEQAGKGDRVSFYPKAN